MRELFIYYRLQAVDATAARAAVHELHAQLQQCHPGLVARCLCREDTVDGRQTWMETYSIDPAHDPAGVSAALQADIETRAGVLLTMLDGPRHTEAFSACAS